MMTRDGIPYVAGMTLYSLVCGHDPISKYTLLEYPNTSIDSQGLVRNELGSLNSIEFYYGKKANAAQVVINYYEWLENANKQCLKDWKTTLDQCPR